MSKSARSASEHGGGPELTIVIPAHNEAGRIGPTLRRYSSYFGRRAEMVIVLNGCTDGTLDAVKAVAAASPATIRSINIAEPIGKGGAVARGFAEARAPTVGFVDADGATTPEEYDRLASLVSKYDGVIGSRWIRGATVYNRTSLLRKIVSYGFVLLTRVLFHLPYQDTQCGVKIFKRTIVERIVPKLRNRDMTFDVELLVLARSLGFTIHEEPTVWTDQSSSFLLGSPSRIVRTSITMLRSLLNLYRRARHEHLL